MEILYIVTVGLLILWSIDQSHRIRRLERRVFHLEFQKRPNNIEDAARLSYGEDPE